MAAPPHFDAVVVGSGFGGSVVAHRLAEAGRSVCLLERGRVWGPNDFPRSPHDMSRNVWDPSRGYHGMFNLWSFGRIGGVVSAGLGGGSLIYANVLLRKDEETFVQEDLARGGYVYWLVTRADLEPHYDRVERMLDAQPYPYQRAGTPRTPERDRYNRTPKTAAMEQAAARLGHEWLLPKLAVTFANPGQEPAPGIPIEGAPENLHGTIRLTCRLVGECDIGCPYGSKNTLDYTYLSLAKLRHGADIRVRCEVKEFEPRDGGGWTVEYVDHADAREGEERRGDLRRHRVTADRLVLSAGAFGTTFLLLKMARRGKLRGLSPALGSRFSGNGDLLTFLFKAMDRTPGKPFPRLLDGGYGPVITSAIRVPDKRDGGGLGRGFYIEDSGFPQFVSWIVETSNQLGYLRRGVRLATRVARGWIGLDDDADIGAEFAAFLGPAALSASSLPLLAMGRDIPDGRMSLSDAERLQLDWRTGKSGPFFERIRSTGRDIARVLDAGYRDNPLWYFRRRVVTVHPLGGCPMGRHEGEGVVDADGAVFGQRGLYVADGAVMPGPVGPNPSLTIAALADRIAERML